MRPGPLNRCNGHFLLTADFHPKVLPIKEVERIKHKTAY